MSRLSRIHLAGSILGMCTLLLFFSATVVVETFGRPEEIIAVKLMIPWALLWLIPVLAVTGFTGARLARNERTGLLGTKLWRMKLIAANGVLLLTPVALFLARKAAQGRLDDWFYAAQSLELAVGALNLTLMALNARDGIRLTRRVRGAAPPS